MNDSSQACEALMPIIFATYADGEVIICGFLLALVAMLFILLLIWFEDGVKAAAIFVFSYIPGAFLILDRKHRTAEAKVRTSSDELELAAIAERTDLLEEHRTRVCKARKLITEDLRRDSEILRLTKSRMRQVIDNASVSNPKDSQLSCRCQECGNRIFFPVEDYEKSIDCPTDTCSSIIRLA